jgi:hypothetical protein
MDDFNVNTLHESRNEWASRLITILTPLIIDGYKSILDEAIKICKDNNEFDKYLMTFQNYISRIPKWNPNIIENEKKRILDKSGCSYLEDLITCVHIIQLKALTAMRVGTKQKKIDINIPKIDDFIHKVYINVARKLYKNVYLFEINIPPLQIQKHNRELEIIVQECILNTLRESIPVESILKAYMDETIEEDVVEEVKEQYITEPLKNNDTDNIKNNNNSNFNNKENISNSSKLSFNDIDYTKDENNNIVQINAPKSIERLEQISELRANQKRLENEDDEDTIRLNISDQNISLDNLDLHVLDEQKIDILPDLLIDDIEVLE